MEQHDEQEAIDEVEAFKRKLGASKLKRILRHERRTSKFTSVYQIRKYLDLLKEERRLRLEERTW